MQRGAYARRLDPDTSHQAAYHVRVTYYEWLTLKAIEQLGGKAITKEIVPEINRHLKKEKHVHLGYITPRMKPLERKGLIRRTNERREDSIVWQLLCRPSRFYEG